jgi:glycogen debranching enzyme
VLAKVELRDGGVPLELSVDATATELAIECEAGSLRAAFDATGGISVTAHGVSVRLATTLVGEALLYSETRNAVAINARPLLRKYALTVNAGELHYFRSDQPAYDGAWVVDVQPDRDGTVEFSIQEYWSTPPQKGLARFDTVRSDADSAFSEFVAAFGSPPADNEMKAAWLKAIYLLWSCSVAPTGLLKRDAVFMSLNWMDQIWSWDNCFNAVALAGAHDALAWDQWMLPFDLQDEHGALPDGFNDVFLHYNFIKPPVHAWALNKLSQRSSAEPTIDQRRTVYEKLSRHADWFLKRRRRSQGELPYYLHGNDAGWDNATAFDAGVPLVSPDLAAFLILQCETLAALAKSVGDQEACDRWDTLRGDLSAKLLDLWDRRRFVPRRITRDGGVEPVQSDSLIPCVPVVLGQRLPKEITEALIADIRRFVTDHGLATEDPKSSKYTPDGYWRGPVWAPSTYLIVDGLLSLGALDLAADIATAFCRTCASGGFAENFDALTGAPLRDPAYTWTASVFLLLLEHRKG